MSCPASVHITLSEGDSMNTRTIAIVALIIAVILVLALFVF